MTREEAIDILEEVKELDDSIYQYNTKYLKALDMAIQALEQEPCEDAISRREAIKMFTYNYKGERIPNYDCDNFPVQIAMKTVKKMLRELPPVKPQERTGHWNLFHTTEHGMREDSYFKCNRCNYESYKEYNFCPDCGAKMVEPRERSE